MDIIYKKRCETTTYYYTGIVSIITYVKQIVITDRKFLGIFPLKDKVIFKITNSNLEESDEAQVVKVIERNMKFVVGEVKAYYGHKQFIPLDNKLNVYFCKNKPKKMKAIWTILLLIASNIFMTFAWYGHLKLQEMKISSSWPLILVILFSWGVAFLEYCAQVPANRIGFIENGGPFNLMQLKVIQEVISLTVFPLIAMFMFKGQTLQWNHIAAFFCLIMAVFFVFLK